ncbi:MAG: phosphotransacetylase family protein [Candidatus Odinarchaeia archaeon]
MKNLFVTSWSGYSGKTGFCLGLAQVLMEKGYKVGYFRPIGRPSFSDKDELIDKDVYLMKKVLKLPYDLNEIVPILLEHHYISIYAKKNINEIKENILKKYEEIASNSDIMIIEGGLSPEAMATFGLNNVNMAKLLDSKILTVTGGLEESTIDKIVFYKTIIENENVKYLGAVMNRVPPHLIEKANEKYSNILKERNVKIWGIIPENYEVASPTVREVIELLSGTVLVEGDKNRIIQNILIGAMETESALKYLRKSKNSAVVTGGDRPYIISAAVETNASVIVLTGNLRPTDQILNTAEEKNITVIMVPHDSYTTVKALEKLTGKIHPTDKKRIKLTKEMVEKHVAWEELLKSI